MLRRGVRPEEGERAAPADRPHEHDPALRSPQRGEERLRHGDLADDVHLELAAELVERDELERGRDRDPGVVDETVERPADLLDRSRDVRRIGDVERRAARSPRSRSESAASAVRTPP